MAEQSSTLMEELNRRRVYELALHDVRRAIETMKPDEILVGHIYARLAKAVAEAYGLPDPNDPSYTT